MEMLAEFEPLLRTFWYIAIPTSLIFLIQSALAIIGIDGGDADIDTDTDVGDAGFGAYLSLKNLINFLLGFAWTGVFMYNDFSNKTSLVFTAILVGMAFVFLFFFVMEKMKDLAEDNSFKIEETIGQIAEVYLPIPADFEGKGKVLVNVKGSTHELQAITKGDRLETSSMVKVLSVKNNSILIVEKL